MSMFKMCLNWKVIGGLAAAGLGVAVFAPNLIGAALPLLLLAACPLSMIVMMGAIGGMGMRSKQGAAEPVRGRVPLPDTRREEQIADLKSQLVRVQSEQERLARAIAELEKGGMAATAIATPQLGKLH